MLSLLTVQEYRAAILMINVSLDYMSGITKILIDFLLYSNNFTNIDAVVVDGSGLCGFKLSGPRLFILYDSVFSQLLRYYSCVEGYPAKVGTTDVPIYLAALVVGSL